MQLGWRSRNWHTHTHIVSLVIHRVDGALGNRKGSDAILAHVGVARPPIKLKGYEHREDVVGGGGAGNDTPTHPHTQCRS